MEIIQVSLDDLESIEKTVAKLKAEGWAGIANGRKEKSCTGWPWKTEIGSKQAKAGYWVFYTLTKDGRFHIWDRVKPVGK